MAADGRGKSSVGAVSGSLPMAAAFRESAARAGAAGSAATTAVGPSDVALERRLSELVEIGRRSWPDVEVGPEELASYWGARAGVAELFDLPDERAADGYIACACMRGDRAALVALERRFFPAIEPSLRRLRLDRAALDEAQQKLRRELFVSEDGAPPRIAHYAGRGDLGGWLRVTAVRSALKMLRGRRNDTPFEEEQLAERVPVAADEPDLAYMKELYRPVFKAAFGEALGSLSPRDQTLLKQHLLDGLSIDQLASVYQVHRATAARWLVAAREALMHGTRERFQVRAKIGSEECDSIMRMIRSQLDVTLRGQLGSSMRGKA